jgi:exportin-1
MSIDILFDDKLPYEGPKLDLLESIIKVVFSGDSLKMAEASQVLENLKDNHQLWLFSQPIINNARNAETVFFALSTLQQGISTKWNLLSDVQGMAIRNFVAELIFKWATNPGLRETKMCLSKANSVLVEIVKREWRTTWKTAISEIVKSSYQNQMICANNLNILKELSQEIFTYSKNSLTSHEINELKDNFANEFKSIYEVCDYVAKAYLANPQNVDKALVKSCLETLQSFLSWMPPYYVLLTDLLDVILLGLIKEKRFLISVMRCFEETFAMDLSYMKDDPELLPKVQEKLIISFGLFLEAIMKIQPPQRSFEVERKSLQNREFKDLNFFQIFTQTFAMSLSNFYKTHLNWIKVWIVKQEAWYEITMRLRAGLAYMAALTEVRDSTLFKTVVEFWLFFIEDLWNLNSLTENEALNGRPNFGKSNKNFLLNLSEPIEDKFLNELEGPLKEGVMFLVMRVPKPQEVLITIDEEGLPRREELANTENLIMYEMVRKILRTFAGKYYSDLRQIIHYKLDRQIDGSEWSYEGINSLSFATGCLSEIVSAIEERPLLIFMLRTLLNFCATKLETEDKAVIATNIMHIVSQHQRFLKDYWEFSITVMKKLFEFVKEKFPGVAEMACNTLLKITSNLKDEFVVTHIKQDMVPETEPYICKLLEDLGGIVFNLDLARKFDIYESIGQIISAEPKEQLKMEYLISAERELEELWMVVQQNLTNKEFLVASESASNISVFLRINSKFCESIGLSYRIYFERCFMKIDVLYNAYQHLEVEMVQQQGIQALEYALMKKFRGVRKDILNLLTSYVAVFKTDPYSFVTNYGSLLIGILESYANEQAEIREHEVLLLLAESIKILGKNSSELLSTSLPLVLAAVLPMITQDFNSYIETRLSFFSLLQSIASNCFEAFLSIPADVFKTIVDCIIWAMKHETPNIHELGLETLITLLENINRNDQFLQTFYKFYFANLINDLLFIMTDKLHTNSLGSQSKCLHILLLVSQRFQFSTFGGTGNNSEQIYQYILDVMSKNFDNLARGDHQKCLTALFTVVQSGEKPFKTALRDYLINLNLFTKRDEEPN